MITKEAEEITEKIYRAYGSGTGFLFGIESKRRKAVEAIIQCVLDIIEEEQE